MNEGWEESEGIRICFREAVFLVALGRIIQKSELG